MGLSVKYRINQVQFMADLERMSEFVILKLNLAIDANVFLADIQITHNFIKFDRVANLENFDCILVECESNIEASRAVDILNEYGQVVYAEPNYIHSLYEWRIVKSSATVPKRKLG